MLRSRSVRPCCHPSNGQVPQDGGHAGHLEPAGSRESGVLEGLGQSAAASEASMGNLDPPGMPDGAEHGLLVVPPHPSYLVAVTTTELRGGPRGHSPVHEDQLQPPGDTLP